MSDTPKHQPPSTDDSPINPDQPPPLTKEETPMTISPIPTKPDDIIYGCECKDWMRSACYWEKVYKEHDGKRYCVLHYPGAEKKEDFYAALERKKDNEDFDFQGVWFPDFVSFSGEHFNSEVNFRQAQFSAKADFSNARFNAKADFSDAQFNASAIFNSAHFSANAPFRGAHFGALVFFHSVHFNKDAEFYNAQFDADADFHRAQFHADAHFDSAQFGAAVHFFGTQFYRDAYFFSTQLNAEAFFSATQFHAMAEFSYAQFSRDVYFNAALFGKETSFNNAVFNANAYFERVWFGEEDSTSRHSPDSDNRIIKTVDAAGTEAKVNSVSFIGTTFKGGLKFEENRFRRVFMSFAAATFEKPERVIFHTVPLRPHWFINVDSRRFTFIDVNWGALDRRDALAKEIAALERSNYGDLSRLLNITLRQLAVNAEENNRYAEAANFRYMAMEAKRLRGWGGRNNIWDKITRFLLRGLDWLRQQRLWRAVSRFNLGWWYWLMSGYGERVARAFVVLLSIWLLFAAIYWSGNATWWQPKQSAARAAQVSAPVQPSTVGRAAPAASGVAPMPITEAAVYSAYVMALQKPEPLPATMLAKAVVLFEMILGPVQAALLALAIRRKFMR